MTGVELATAERVAEIAANLARVEERLVTACAAAGRPRDEVTLVVVTKYFPASDVRALAGLGVRHVAENRHQEAVAKRAATEDLDLVRHFIGHLQSNKAHTVAAWADVVESVDRERLVPALARGAGAARPLAVLLQVSLDPPGLAEGRSGADPADVPALARLVADDPHLSLRGVMGVAPRGEDPRPAFERLAEVSLAVREVDPAATWVSAGMSGDLEQAVAAGATHVRIGSAVLGNRPARG